MHNSSAPSRAGTVIFWSSLLFILGATLFPYRFMALTAAMRLADIGWVSFSLSNWQEPARNVLLFMPLGFGWGLLFARGKRPFPALRNSALTGFSLSLLVELLQLLVPERTPALADIFTNSLGAALGYLLYLAWQRRLAARWPTGRWQTGPTGRWLLWAGLSLGYLLLLPIFWQQVLADVSLQNWELAYPLLLYNEKTGERRWQGSVEQLYFSDQVWTEAQMAAGLRQQQPTNLPLLAWYDFRLSREDQLGLLPVFAERMPRDHNDPTRWLGASPANRLNAAMREASRWTVGMVVQTAVPDQQGPARIMSLSGTIRQRNLTVAQQGDDLLVRLRTPVSGTNGERPELIVPGVFAARRPHHLIMSYDGRYFRIVVDEMSQLAQFDMTEVAVAQRFFSVSYVQPVLLPLNQGGYHAFQIGTLLLPLLFLFWLRPYARLRQ